MKNHSAWWWIALPVRIAAGVALVPVFLAAALLHYTFLLVGSLAICLMAAIAPRSPLLDRIASWL
jgi:hypothetical protein